MSWAALVKAPAAASTPEAPAAAPLHESRVAVVDANAIISGLSLAGLAERYVTIQEVLDEVRDKHARQVLATLPFSLEVKEPEPASLTAVTAFARETGDLHALSQADLKLLALAHALEAAAHGTAHLRQHPVQVVAKPKHRSKGRGLPGWGVVPNPQDWAAIDALPDSASAPGSSRIRAAAQDLDAAAATSTTSNGRPAPDGSAAPAAQAPAFASFGDATAAELAAKVDGAAEQLQAAQWFKGPAAAQGQPHQQAQQQGGDMFAGVSHFTGDATAAALPGPPHQASASGGAQAPEQEDEDDEDDEEEEDDDGWETAKGSRGAARRAKRKQMRWEARQQLRQQQQQAEAGTSQQEGVAATEAAAEASTPQQQPVGAADGTQQHEEGEEEGEENGEGEEEEDEGETEGEEDEEEGEDEGEEAEEGASTAAGTEAAASEAAASHEHSEVAPNTTSNVLSVTADFAMQNVLLQMGLRLVTPNGKQITRLSRWVVRCSACFFVTKEVGRMFCPKCGNMTLERVEVTVGPGGAELYGVRKRHVLRGTVFSLPKPKGGRAPNPILREDELLQKVRPRRKKAPPKQQDLDPFAPEFSQDTWHTSSGAPTQAALASTKGAAYTLASWKHNPNERRPVATNRRRK